MGKDTLAAVAWLLALWLEASSRLLRCHFCGNWGPKLLRRDFVRARTGRRRTAPPLLTRRTT